MTWAQATALMTSVSAGGARHQDGSPVTVAAGRPWRVQDAGDPHCRPPPDHGELEGAGPGGGDLPGATERGAVTALQRQREQSLGSWEQRSRASSPQRKERGATPALVIQSLVTRTRPAWSIPDRSREQGRGSQPPGGTGRRGRSGVWMGQQGE